MLSLNFEKRLTQATFSKMDMNKFLHQEEIILDDLMKKEEELLENDQSQTGNGDLENDPSFADKMISDFQKRMAQYEEAFYHKDAAPDVTRLYGALKKWDSDSWPQVYPLLIRAFPQWKSTRLSKMEHTLWELTATRGKNIPLKLEKYHWMLESPNTDPADLNREARNCIIDAALFLHDMKSTLTAYLEKEAPNESIETGLNMVQNIINDFRLKDLKRED
jgi:hypothetical protein